jgi:hypothetical protein
MVTVLNTFSKVGPVTNVQSYSQEEKKEIQIKL